MSNATFTLRYTPVSNATFTLCYAPVSNATFTLCYTPVSNAIFTLHYTPVSNATFTLRYAPVSNAAFLHIRYNQWLASCPISRTFNNQKCVRTTICQQHTISKQVSYQSGRDLLTKICIKLHKTQMRSFTKFYLTRKMIPKISCNVSSGTSNPTMLIAH